MSHICLLDPALPSIDGEPSDNLGDSIISEAIMKELQDLRHFQFHRLPTKRKLTTSELELAREADIVLLGGSNLLSSNLRRYNQWKISASVRNLISPPLTDVICCGTGWWQYQAAPTYRTRLFYSRVLSPKRLHSVRDRYSEIKLRRCGIENVVNTSCPTLWSLHGRETNHRQGKNIVFTLTDYMRDVDRDNALISLLGRVANGEMAFFPQGIHDVEYLRSLDSFRAYRSRIAILPRSLKSLNDLASSEDTVYVGTRLHCGARVMQLGRNALIIAVDNRAAEIKKDIGLPVVLRDDFPTISRWLAGLTDWAPIELPLDGIKQWKQQFASD